MRFGPLPKIITLGRSVTARLRRLTRRSSRDKACAPRTPPHRYRRAGRVGTDTPAPRCAAHAISALRSVSNCGQMASAQANRLARRSAGESRASLERQQLPQTSINLARVGAETRDRYLVTCDDLLSAPWRSAARSPPDDLRRNSRRRCDFRSFSARLLQPVTSKRHQRQSRASASP